MPDQQRHFCAAYQEDTARHHDYDAKLATAHEKAAGNPVAERAIHITPCQTRGSFRARQASVMGDGSFQNWVASVKLGLSGDQVSLNFEFPCEWTDWSRDTHTTHPNVSFDAAFGTRNGISIDSEAGKSLASVVQGETVIVFGRFFCAAPSSPPYSVPDGGCTDTAGMLRASIGSMRSVKSGAVWRFPNQRGAGISFNRSDDYETLRKKAQKAGASALAEYLNSTTANHRLPSSSG